MRDRLARILWALRHPVWVFGPRCGAAGPWRLADCGTCICPRGHEQDGREGAEWHGDGTGYIWTEDRWAWRGPIVNLADELRDDPDRDTWGDQYAVFTETPQPDA